LALAPLRAQNDIGDLTKFQTVFSAITLAATSNPIINQGQGSHIMMVDFPTAVGAVTPIQVRFEVAYTCPDPPTCATGNWVPISADITSAPFLGGRAYAMIRVNGAFPAIRIRSLLATPGALPMTVYYTGMPFGIGVCAVYADRWLCNAQGAAYDKATFVICNGVACAVAANITNEYIVVASLRFRECHIFAKTAPTGAALIVDINRNGTSIFGAPKLTFPAGGVAVVTASNFAAAQIAVVRLDRLTVDIDQIGAVTPGQDVTVTCVLDP
jgi:hypothetical protein